MSPLPDFLRRLASLAHQGCVHVAFAVFDSLLPVRDDYWCFCTWEEYPHTLDNPRAVFEEVKHDPSVHKIVLQKDTSSSPVHEGLNVTFVPVESLRGAYYLATSRILVLGYALFGLSSYADRTDASRHTIIQLWHGIPLKRIGRLFSGEDFWQDETGRYAATVCSSKQDREIMTRAFAPLARKRVWQTGLPRNTFIEREAAGLPADYREHLERLDRKLDGRRLVLYAPTWRKHPESLYTFSDDEETKLGRLLDRRDAVLGIRGHPNVRGNDVYECRCGSGVIFSANEWPDPNVLLRRTDVLVTDYSSIYIDFLLLDRPILHFAYDLEDYRSERGFLYEPEKAFAGPTVRTFDDLVDRLEVALADPGAFAGQRERARRLFHDHPDDSAAEVTRRIARLVNAEEGTDGPGADDLEEGRASVVRSRGAAS